MVGSRYLIVVVIAILTLNIGVYANGEEIIDMDGDDEFQVEMENIPVSVEPDIIESVVSDKEESDEEEERTLIAPQDADTYFLFIKTSGSSLEIPAGKDVQFLVGFTNKGTKDFVIETMDASFRYPVDFSFYIQNEMSLKLILFLLILATSIMALHYLEIGCYLKTINMLYYIVNYEILKYVCVAIFGYFLPDILRCFLKICGFQKKGIEKKSIASMWHRNQEGQPGVFFKIVQTFSMTRITSSIRTVLMITIFSTYIFCQLSFGYIQYLLNHNSDKSKINTQIAIQNFFSYNNVNITIN